MELHTPEEHTNGELAAQKWVEEGTENETERFNTFIARFALIPEISLTPEVS